LRLKGAWVFGRRGRVSRAHCVLIPKKREGFSTCGMEGKGKTAHYLKRRMGVRRKQY
jgi:hypothetical protein